MNSATRRRWAIRTLLGLGFLCYCNAFRGEFVFDDILYIVRNSALRTINFENIMALWNYAPTRIISFLTLLGNYQLSGLHVVSYHVLNVVIHLVAAVTVYHLALILLRLPGFQIRSPIHSAADGEVLNELTAFFVAMFFVAHPLQTEAVAYIWQRCASLAALFYFLSIYFYVKGGLENSPGALRWSLVFAIFGMFTKQTCVTLPATILAIEYFGFGFNLKKDDAPKRWDRLIPILATLAIIPFTFFIAGDYDWHETHLGVWASKVPPQPEYFLTQINVVRQYIFLLFFPLHQTAEYDIPLVHTLFHLDVLASLALHLSLFGAAFALRKKNPLFTFGVLFFYLTLSVESSVVRLGDLMFEHRIYLPSFGFFLAISALLRNAPIFRRVEDGHGQLHFKPWAGAVALLVIPFALLTVRRNRVWETPESFWLDAAVKAPNKARPNMSAGRVLLSKGDHKGGDMFLKRALASEPDDTMSIYSLALEDIEQNQFEEAQKKIKLLEQYEGDTPEPYYVRAVLELKQRHNDIALDYFLKAVDKTAITPDTEDVVKNSFLNIAIIASRKTDWERTIWACARFLGRDPSLIEVHALLANALMKKGDFESAHKEYLRMLDMDPKNDGTYNDMAVLFERQGKIDEAIGAYQQALRLAPDHPPARVNLLLLTIKSGRQNQASELYHNLPDLGMIAFSAYSMIGKEYYDRGDCPSTIESLEKAVSLFSKEHDDSKVISKDHQALAVCYKKMGNVALSNEHSKMVRDLAHEK
jgi:protein O-mannosyl-transferase